MDQRLEELAQYILRIVPQAKAISNLQKDSKVGIVRFNWNSHQFVVKPSLEVIEIKGQNLFVTGASMLLQAALLTAEKNNRVLTVIDETLRQAEDFLSNHQSEKAFELLKSVKLTLGKLIGPRPNRA